MVFGKLLKALKKTRDVLTTGLSRLFKGRQLDDAFLEELEEVLYNSDLGPLGTKIVVLKPFGCPALASKALALSTSSL